MAKLSYKMSYYIFYAIVLISIVVLGLFYTVGYENPMGNYNAPQHTETLIYLMYALAAVCVLVTVLGGLAQFVAGLRDNPKGAVKSLIGLGLFIVVLVASFSAASDAPLAMADGSMYEDTYWLKLTDGMIYSIYVLFGVAAVATLINLSGIFKR